MKHASRVLVQILLGACLAIGTPSFAQTGQTVVVTPSQYIELLRTDIRADKVALLTEALNLTEVESAKFWPIFREYETDLARLDDRRIVLIKDFAENYGAVTESDARDIASVHFGIQRDKLRLRERYFRRIASATSARTAARFIQIENVVASMIDLQIAAELPLLE